jgi:hypothetical protein
MVADLQSAFDVGIVMTTVVRPSIAQAVRSVFAQRFGGRIQVLVGIDQWKGERALLASLIAEAPSHVAMTVIDLGYSTSRRHGGSYPSDYGGALKTILSFAANSRHVAYLDDDNWYAPDHVTSMLEAVAGKAWGFSLRHMVDRQTGAHICPDTWESMGPGRGVYAEAQGGFVDTNCYVLDAQACYDVFPEWAMTRFGGTGGDRQVLKLLAGRSWGTNGRHTVYYRATLIGQHPYLLWRYRCAGVDLARFMPPEAIPGDDVWRQCAELDRAKAASGDATAPTGDTNAVNAHSAGSAAASRAPT